MHKVANKQNTSRLLGVHDATLMRWVREGRFPKPFRLCPRGRVFFDLDEVDVFIEARKHEIMSAAP